ncbi:hypothetical protein N7478_004532 [Penicillium angulare]|uniref:uncharacterized protein n=1 Tax=Penicillium angulare TaxID=116970 RepID=UPI002540096D|nr:uncharacterized protein N7478_004532 [Penicillium angulare]KAJ5279160.1 hypothetical protein N7478_004532 [Penicillium angulare]
MRKTEQNYEMESVEEELERKPTKEIDNLDNDCSEFEFYLGKSEIFAAYRHIAGFIGGIQ